VTPGQHDNGSPVRASVLVPVLNEEAHIRETVDAMRAQRLEGPIEFLFMDGRSSDGTRAILDELADSDVRIRVFDNPGRTTPHALNIGLANARGAYVARMDAHAYYPPDYVARGIERLERGGVDWVAGPAIPRGEGRWSRRVALALNAGLGTVGSRKWRAEAPAAEAAEVELDTGVFAGVWRRETLDAHDGWDVEWPINQDSELAARVLGAGGRIVLVPEMGAEYVPRNTLGGLAKQYWRYGRYRAKTSIRHSNSLRRSHMLAPGLVIAAAGALAAPRPARLASRGLLAAYAAVLVAASARASKAASRNDAAALPLVFAIMHASWGAGFIYTSVREGPPLEALAHLAGLRGS
jgi:glycosyltransferase involved in cell wall biosynthesis